MFDYKTPLLFIRYDRLEAEDVGSFLRSCAPQDALYIAIGGVIDDEFAPKGFAEEVIEALKYALDDVSDLWIQRVVGEQIDWIVVGPFSKIDHRFKAVFNATEFRTLQDLKDHMHGEVVSKLGLEEPVHAKREDRHRWSGK